MVLILSHEYKCFITSGKIDFFRWYEIEKPFESLIIILNNLIYLAEMLQNKDNHFDNI